MGTKEARRILQATVEKVTTMRKQDAWGKPLVKVGDVVEAIAIPNDPGTVTKIIQVNANGAHVVAVKWFTWDNGRTTQEYVKELQIVSRA